MAKCDPPPEICSASFDYACVVDDNIGRFLLKGARELFLGETVGDRP